MTFALVWLADVLHSAGLTVVEESGWKERGHGDMGFVRGALCHHTAGPLTGNAPSLNTVINGRPDLAGPLSALLLGRDGTFYVIAAGKSWHAGAGMWQGITSGNSQLIGIEAENTGLPNDPWPPGQMDAYARGCAAILKHIGADSSWCVGHYEWALPKGRKTDPSFSMTDFRIKVAAHMNSGH
jgi:hypothetical protein